MVYDRGKWLHRPHHLVDRFHSPHNFIVSHLLLLSFGHLISGWRAMRKLVDGLTESLILTSNSPDLETESNLFLFHLTLFSLGFFFLAAGEAFREAEARIAPAAFWL